MNEKPIDALEIPEQARKTIYPMPFAALVAGRVKRRLGDHFGLMNYGVNLTQLAPGSASALLHRHSKEDEFIYILSGTHQMAPGECCGFKAGAGQIHQLLNRTAQMVTYLEIGNRHPQDLVEYPKDDLMFAKRPDGRVYLAHKDGAPY